MKINLRQPHLLHLSIFIPLAYHANDFFRNILTNFIQRSINKIY
ncbi:hypothetical protein EAM_1112 [Erwinia amylovora ATCC 49946]|nr:hypothetical protein EAM_1112 [Erwinia amylovora ATCC 49946]